ncbi:MAG: polyhydroxybutyrate depolymerase [Candidatus Azotimanducaceae bacterium]
MPEQALGPGVFADMVIRWVLAHPENSVTMSLSISLIRLLLVVCSLAGVSYSHAATITTPRSDVELKVPENYSAETPRPLVLLLHGYTSSGAGQDSYMKFSALVNEYDFLLLLPDGTVEKQGQKNRFWNATLACCNMQASDVDDSTFLADLIAETKKQYAVDENQIYLIGHSNGGFMSHRLAYDHPETIAAIASLAGAAPSELSGTPPTRPVNILQIHGSEDSTIKYEGGEIRGAAYASAHQTMESWVNYLAATPATQVTDARLDLDVSIAGNETTVTHFDAQGNLALWTIQNGAHVPNLSDTFNRHVIEWLFAHPKSTL